MCVWSEKEKVQEVYMKKLRKLLQNSKPQPLTSPGKDPCINESKKLKAVYNF